MDYKGNIKNHLRRLTGDGAIGVSGQEQEIIDVICELLEGHADEITVSTSGNVTVMKKGKAPGPVMGVAAHMDEVGYRIKNILPSGFLVLTVVGGVPGPVAIGRKVWIGRERIPGVIGMKPAHLQTPEDMKSVPDISKCYVDVGCATAQEVLDMGIEIGDAVIIQNDLMEFRNPDLICTRALDDRINCAIIVELFRSLRAEDFDGTLYAFFSTREEVGLLGAHNSLEGIDVDYIIALDTIPAMDTPDANTAELPLFLGKGPGLTIAEHFGFNNFYLIHPGVKKQILGAASEAGINLQTVSMASIGYLTEASAYSCMKGGIPSAAMTVPRRYSHSPVEVANLNDADGLVKVLLGVVKKNASINLAFRQ